ncbi:MAG TPA: hypothetical protein VFU89_02310 [Rhabdochlamydiaceae bacterium]|nr:hypothetical protein [Rhabdochlamydiaceae bacterium]
MKKHLLALLLTVPSLIFARKTLEYGKLASEEGPWLTGPIVTPAPHVVPVGHQNYEQYLFWYQFKGVYNDHWRPVKKPLFTTIQSQTLFQFGVLPATEIDIFPTFQYNHFMHMHKWCFSDLPVSISFQLLMDKPDEWWPSIKLRLGAIVPLGKHDRLDPPKIGTDLSGTGNWSPGISLVFGRLFNFGNYNFLALRFAAKYEFGTSVNIHGESAYVGAPDSDGVTGTRGRVYPGQVLTLEQGIEYSITHNWAFAMDIVYKHCNRTCFKGQTPPGSTVGYRSAELLSLAPAIEYNFNANIGIIFGPWFTVIGRNNNLTADYIAWVFAVNIFN